MKTALVFACGFIAGALTGRLTFSTPTAPRDPATLLASQAEEAAPEFDLHFPLPDYRPKDLHDTFTAKRGESGQHEAIDMVAPKGTPVYAVDNGRIAKLFLSKPGGITIYQFNPRETHCYYYAHLDGYASGLKEGDDVRRGDIIAFVGNTGNAGSVFHLHFAIFKLGPEKRWWQGTAINPYPALLRAIK